jgi:hypothetical protein
MLAVREQARGAGVQHTVCCLADCTTRDGGLPCRHTASCTGRILYKAEHRVAKRMGAKG